MKKQEIIFGRSYSPVSVAIQLRTWFKYSHVGWVIDDSVIEARGGFGVVVTPLVEFNSRYKETEIRVIYCVNDDVITDVSRVIGSKYDKKAFWGIAFGLDFDEACAYQCAELVGKYSGTMNPDITNRLTPKDIWKISHAIK